MSSLYYKELKKKSNIYIYFHLFEIISYKFKQEERLAREAEEARLATEAAAEAKRKQEEAAAEASKAAEEAKKAEEERQKKVAQEMKTLKDSIANAEQNAAKLSAQKVLPIKIFELELRTDPSKETKRERSGTKRVVFFSFSVFLLL